MKTIDKQDHACQTNETHDAALKFAVKSQLCYVSWPVLGTNVVGLTALKEGRHEESRLHYIFESWTFLQSQLRPTARLEDTYKERSIWEL